MFATVSVTLSHSTLAALLAQSEPGSGSEQLSGAIASAVDFWLAHRHQLAEEPMSSLQGYQWKSLFLPHGTMLRTWSYGEHRYARIEGDHLVYEGQTMSPNQFARSFARTTRNAWTDLSVRRPGDKTFQLASHLRRQLARETALQPPAQALPPAAPAAAAPEAPPPVSPPCKGWSLPERRTMRYRIEDVAFE